MSVQEREHGEIPENAVHRGHDKCEAVRLSDEIVAGLVQSLSAISEQNKSHGVPPPKDFDDTFMSGSFFSNDSSIIGDDISYISDISEIREKNTELRRTIKKTVKLFKDTSKEFLSHSIIISDKKNALVNELENVKKVLVDAMEENKCNKSQIEHEINIENKDDEAMKSIYDQIYMIQAEIRIASDRLGETEAMIHRTDMENFSLTKRLKCLGDSLNIIMQKEEDEVDVRKGCKCGVF